MFPAAEAMAKGGGAIDCTVIDSGQGFPKEYSSRKPPLAFYAFIEAKPSAMSARPYLAWSFVIKSVVQTQE
jgi:hypothetical protein